MGNITPVHKKDLLQLASNYRPISLLCILNKVLERLVRNGLRAQVKQLITILQHGFQRNRSCVTQLLTVLHDIRKNLDQNVQTDVLYLDFAKAFDSVVHEHVGFVNHGRTRRSQSGEYLEIPYCRTSAFKSLYFNRNY